MMKREQGQECDGSQEEMWAKDVDETGQLTYFYYLCLSNVLLKRDRYTNVITELSQKQEPPDCRGGLLADQMGLGKTLTMISLIALNPSTSKEPFRFFSSCPALRCTKSTLIVVPFTCRPQRLHIFAELTCTSARGLGYSVEPVSSVEF
jgi:hypothetical protein